MEKGNNCVEVRKLRHPPRLARTILPLIAPSWLMVSTLTNITAGGWKMCFFLCSFLLVYWFLISQFQEILALRWGQGSTHNVPRRPVEWERTRGSAIQRWGGDVRLGQAGGLRRSVTHHSDHRAISVCYFFPGQLVNYYDSFQMKRCADYISLLEEVRICLWKVGLRWLWSELHGRHR